jgi:hypothetical protein
MVSFLVVIMSKDRNYLLPPEGEETPEINCCLIFFPDNDAYRRALWGSLDYLGTWTAWERDDDKRGQLAAAIWKEANEQTEECYDMGCFDELIQTIVNIKIQNQFSWDCNCGVIVIVPPNPTIPPITYNEGDPPSTYGETEIDDWAHWRRVVCANADAYVDMLIEQNNYLTTVITAGAILITIIGTIMGIVFSGGLALAVGASAASAVVAGLIELGSAEAFQTFEEDIEAVRDDIRCAIVCGLELSDIIEAAIDEDAWNYFYRFADWSRVAAIIRAGELEGQYLDGTIESSECSDCVCPEYFTLDYDFTVNNGSFTGSGFAYSIAGCWYHNIADGAEDRVYLSYVNLCAAVGVSNGTPLKITRVVVDFAPHPTNPPSQSWSLFSRIYRAFTSSTYTETTHTAGVGESGQIEHIDPAPEFTTDCSPGFGGTGIGNIGGEQWWKYCAIHIEGEIYQGA